MCKCCLSIDGAYYCPLVLHSQVEELKRDLSISTEELMYALINPTKQVCFCVLIENSISTHPLPSARLLFTPPLTPYVAGSDGVTNVSRKWCCWLWWCYNCVTQVVLLALVVLQICHASGVASSGSVTNVSLKWCCWLW